MRRCLIGIITLCVFLLGIGACGEGSVDSTTAQAPPETLVPEATATLPPLPTSTIAASPTATSQARLAPDFDFTLSQGEDVLGAQNMKLSQLRGKPLVLNFWTRLCGPCWKEMPELQDFYEEFQEQIELVGIDIGQFTGYGSYRDSTQLLESLGITYPVGFTNDGRVVRGYRVEAMPTTVFISAEGEVLKKWTGALDRDIVTRLATAMLDTEPAR